MRRLIQNAIYLPQCDKYIMSVHRHDWVPFRYDGAKIDDEHPRDGYIDGGDEYQRLGGNFITDPIQNLVKDWCLYEGSTEEEKEKKMLWGTYGKDGKQPLTWVPLCKCEIKHLEAILQTQKQAADSVVKVINSILKKRGVKK